MLLLNMGLLALSAIPISLAKPPHHHSPASNATVPHCPTVTETVLKTIGVCDDLECLPPGPVTSTFVVGCGCPAATPTATLSVCDPGCERSTAWSYTTAGGC